MRRTLSDKQITEPTQVRESISIYLPLELAERFDEAIFLLKKQIPREVRKKLSRSKLHELILENLLTDYFLKGNNGQLYKIISKWNQNNS